MKNNNLTAIQFFGSLFVLVGATLKFFDVAFAPYIFASGAAILLIVQVLFMAAVKNEDKRIQRVHRLMFIATILLGAAAYFMFTRSASWVPFVIAYAVVSLFLSFRSK